MKKNLTLLTLIYSMNLVACMQEKKVIDTHEGVCNKEVLKAKLAKVKEKNKTNILEHKTKLDNMNKNLCSISNKSNLRLAKLKEDDLEKFKTIELNIITKKAIKEKDHAFKKCFIDVEKKIRDMVAKLDKITIDKDNMYKTIQDLHDLIKDITTTTAPVNSKTMDMRNILIEQDNKMVLGYNKIKDSIDKLREKIKPIRKDLHDQLESLSEYLKGSMKNKIGKKGTPLAGKNIKNAKNNDIQIGGRFSEFLYNMQQHRNGGYKPNGDFVGNKTGGVNSDGNASLSNIINKTQNIDNILENTTGINNLIKKLLSLSILNEQKIVEKNNQLSKLDASYSEYFNGRTGAITKFENDLKWYFDKNDGINSILKDLEKTMKDEADKKFKEYDNYINDLGTGLYTMSKNLFLYIDYIPSVSSITDKETKDNLYMRLRHTVEASTHLGDASLQETIQKFTTMIYNAAKKIIKLRSEHKTFCKKLQKTTKTKIAESTEKKNFDQDTASLSKLNNELAVLETAKKDLEKEIALAKKNKNKQKEDSLNLDIYNLEEEIGRKITQIAQQTKALSYAETKYKDYNKNENLKCNHRIKLKEFILNKLGYLGVLGERISNLENAIVFAQNERKINAEKHGYDLDDSKKKAKSYTKFITDCLDKGKKLPVNKSIQFKSLKKQSNSKNIFAKDGLDSDIVNKGIRSAKFVKENYKKKLEYEKDILEKRNKIYKIWQQDLRRLLIKLSTEEGLNCKISIHILYDTWRQQEEENRIGNKIEKNNNKKEKDPGHLAAIHSIDVVYPDDTLELRDPSNLSNLEDGTNNVIFKKQTKKYGNTKINIENCLDNDGTINISERSKSPPGDYGSLVRVKPNTEEIDKSTYKELPSY